MKNIFTKAVSEEIIQRINTLTPQSKPQWGKMTVGQMLAHCNVTYEMIYTDKHPQLNYLAKSLLMTFVKRMVVGEKPYPKNKMTAPYFLITDEKEFEKEKKRLIDYIRKTQELGGDYFHHKESHSFGSLTQTEWNNMLYKHLDHHLKQFGV